MLVSLCFFRCTGFKCVLLCRRSGKLALHGEVYQTCQQNTAQEPQPASLSEEQLVIDLTDTEDELPIASRHDHAKQSGPNTEEARQLSSSDLRRTKRLIKPPGRFQEVTLVALSATDHQGLPGNSICLC